MKQMNYSIEFLRFFFTIGVVVGHAFCVFYQNNNPSYEILFHGACVDFFFVLSGFFLAAHFGENTDRYKNSRAYAGYIFSRIKRLLPLLLVAGLEGIVYESVGGRFHWEKWGTFFFLGGINQFSPWNVIWYISALFWSTLILGALLCFCKERAILVYFPLIAFLSLSVMNIYGNSGLLGSFPLLGGWLSAGLVRGVCGLTFGIEAFFISAYLKESVPHFRNGAITFFSLSVEIAFIILVLYLMFKQKYNNLEFMLFFSAAGLFVVFALNQQRIFQVFNHKIWKIPGQISAMIFVTHYYVEKTLCKISFIRSLPDVAVYALCVISAVLCGLICFTAEKWIEKKISSLVFK